MIYLIIYLAIGSVIGYNFVPNAIMELKKEHSGYRNFQSETIVWLLENIFFKALIYLIVIFFWLPNLLFKIIRRV
jgi:hypothetical protein